MHGLSSAACFMGYWSQRHDDMLSEGIALRSRDDYPRKRWDEVPGTFIER